MVPTLIYTTWYHLEYHFGYQKYSQLHLNLPLDLVLIAAGEDSFFGPKCVIDLLQFLLDFWGGVFLEWLGEPPCLIWFLGGVVVEFWFVVACKTLFWWTGLRFRGLDKVSSRDMETALPGLRSILFPGVLEREYPFPVPCMPELPAGDAVEKVIVGIKSVLRRCAELEEPKFEFAMWNELSPSAIVVKSGTLRSYQYKFEL